MTQAMTIARQHDVSDIERMARAFAASNLFGVTTPEQAVALCLIAQAEGRHPASAAQDYHIIKGKPSKKADAMLRDFLAAGGKVEWNELTDAIADATFSHPAGGTVRISWDMARAKKAQINTPMWSKFPRQMLRARVVSEGVRTVFPMATSGMYVPEEVVEFDAPVRETAIVTVDGEIIESLPAPQSKAKSREPYRGLSAKIKECATLHDLAELWGSTEARSIRDTLPDDWKEQIAAEKDARKLELFDADAFVTKLFAEMEETRSADQVDELWQELKVEQSLEAHAYALADAESIRSSRLKVLAAEIDGEIPF
jgi:hypothetical protein